MVPLRISLHNMTTFGTKSNTFWHKQLNEYPQIILIFLTVSRFFKALREYVNYIYNDPTFLRKSCKVVMAINFS